MNARSTLAEALVKTWVQAYTRGLPASARQGRIDEIASDLWEHRQTAEGAGEPRVATALQILVRLILGAPFDLVWRMETGAAFRAGKERRMRAQSWMSWQSYGGSGRGEKVFLACVGLLLIYQASTVFISGAFGFGLFRGGADEPGNGWYYTLPISLAGVALILAGLQRRIQAPLRSGVYVALGVLPSILMFWMMLPPLVALGVAVYALQHGWSEQKRMDRGHER